MPHRPRIAGDLGDPVEGLTSHGEQAVVAAPGPLQGGQQLPEPLGPPGPLASAVEQWTEVEPTPWRCHIRIKPQPVHPSCPAALGGESFAVRTGPEQAIPPPARAERCARARQTPTLRE